ncbi:hypothetical protein V2J09_011344 [Rumex salicifolius]
MRKSNFFFLKLLILVVIQFWSPASAIRKDPVLEAKICRNTVQGRYILSDDDGYICDALSVDPESRCCPRKGEQFTCHGCNLVSQCCNSYEFCVSCCLNPLRTRKELALQIKIAMPMTAGNYASVFDFCIGRCRHNSQSVVHENAYLSEFHHCFSLSSNSSDSADKHLEERLAGISIIVGRQGESCDSVCKRTARSCVPNKLPVLNECQVMQKHMTCRGGCLSSIGSDQPAEVVDDAPRHLVHVCMPEPTQCSRVMLPISIPEDFAPVLSISLRESMACRSCFEMNCTSEKNTYPLFWAASPASWINSRLVSSSASLKFWASRCCCRTSKVVGRLVVVSAAAAEVAAEADNVNVGNVVLIGLRKREEGRGGGGDKVSREWRRRRVVVVAAAVWRWIEWRVLLAMEFFEY